MVTRESTAPPHPILESLVRIPKVSYLRDMGPYTRPLIIRDVGPTIVTFTHPPPLPLCFQSDDTVQHFIIIIAPY